MPELRRGATNHRWVIVAPERDRRPSDFQQKGTRQSDYVPADCVFCAGNEDKTPPEVYRASTSDGNGWHVRVVPNKYPALQDYDELGRERLAGIYDRMNGVGAHEVVIETPEHCSEIPDLPEAQVVRIVETYIHRIKSLMDNPRLRHVQLFKNHGKEAGASLLHPHSQIIATPIVPQEVRDSLNIAKDYYERKQRCLFCDVISAELKSGERIVDDCDGFVTWAPYDSRFPFELAIYPKVHSHDFTTMDEVQKIGLARTLIRTTQRLKMLLGDVPYNLVLETTPNPISHPGKPGYWRTLQYDYHWRIAVMPKLTRVAGFEWGTGCYINPMPPEEAAKYLREVEIPMP
ncbi:galactose-1-phosphate uridylyltransferase [Candidatus Bipolaricaulota bacterium]